LENVTNGSGPAQGDVPLRERPETLNDLVGLFERVEAEENPDVVLPLASLRLRTTGTVEVPRLGFFGFTDWSRRQCAALLGIRWDRWFENATDVERADEMNRRFARAASTVRLRTSRTMNGGGSHGTLRAFVTAGYSPVPDSQLARMLATVLEPADPELRLVRSDITDRTVSYVVKVGEAFRCGGPGEVGDVWGGLLVRNSGVGFASLLISLHLTRLVCKNGMTAPLPDAVLVRRRHRAIDDGKLRELLSTQLQRLPERLNHGATLLSDARQRPVTDVQMAVRSVLADAALPARHLPAVLAAYDREPEPTAFGIAQAFTRAAQDQTPEIRLDFEQAAGAYLASA
jgi:hypothetical protein